MHSRAGPPGPPTSHLTELTVPPGTTKTLASCEKRSAPPGSPGNVAPSATHGHFLSELRPGPSETSAPATLRVARVLRDAPRGRGASRPAPRAGNGGGARRLLGEAAGPSGRRRGPRRVGGEAGAESWSCAAGALPRPSAWPPSPGLPGTARWMCFGALPADDAAASVKQGAREGGAAHGVEPPGKSEGPAEGQCRRLRVGVRAWGGVGAAGTGGCGRT